MANRQASGNARFTPVAIALACRRAPDTFLQMKLRQGQVWQRGDEYIQIVQVERLSVQYKLRKRLNRKEGSHHTATKKEFCRLLKTAELLPPAESAV
jgi:hypothetical protein